MNDSDEQDQDGHNNVFDEMWATSDGSDVWTVASKYQGDVSKVKRMHNTLPSFYTLIAPQQVDATCWLASTILFCRHTLYHLLKTQSVVSEDW